MNILLVELYYTGSHKQWLDGIENYSSHQYTLLSLRGKYWKWRMSGGAISLAKQMDALSVVPELIICSDMLDLALFKALLSSSYSEVPLWVYFHENQLTYPFQSYQEKDRHYGFINYTSALVADRVLFNSNYHRDVFIQSLHAFLKVLPDERNLQNVAYIESKSFVLPLGLDMEMGTVSIRSGKPVFLWNHRWEYDKNPELFFETLYKMKEGGVDFRLNVLGESFASVLPIFEEAREKLSDRIDHWGFVASREKYLEIVSKSNILLVTSSQDFFGGSVVEAISAGCYPVLPHRLAYPEIIPFEKYFYSTSDQMLKLVLQVIKAKSYLVPNAALINYVKRYSWQNCISEYNSLFATVIK